MAIKINYLQPEPVNSEGETVWPFPKSASASHWPGTKPDPEEDQACKDVALVLKVSSVPEAATISKALTDNPKLANAAMTILQSSDSDQAAVAKFVESVKANDAQQQAHWDCPDDYTILDALKDFANKTMKAPGLWLHAKNGMAVYRVVSYDLQDRRCQLECTNGLKLKPIIGEREVPLYLPRWS